MAEFTTMFRGRPCEIQGYIEPADRDVGIMGESFVAEKIIFTDVDLEVEFEDYDSVTEDEWIAIDEAFWKANPHGYGEDDYSDPETPNDYGEGHYLAEGDEHDMPEG